MQTIKPYIYGAVGLIYILTCIFCYRLGYKNGSDNVTLKVQQATLKQQNTNIARANKISQANNQYLAQKESIITRVIYKTKIIKESSVCVNNGISKEYIDSLNGVLK